MSAGQDFSTTVEDLPGETHQTIKVRDKYPEEAMLQPQKEEAVGTSISMIIPMGAEQNDLGN